MRKVWYRHGTGVENFRIVAGGAKWHEGSTCLSWAPFGPSRGTVRDPIWSYASLIEARDSFRRNLSMSGLGERY